MQKIRNTYVLPTYPDRNYKIYPDKSQISPKDSFERAHTLLYLLRFALKNFKLLLLILVGQLIITVAYVAFVPVKYQAGCTILIQDFQKVGLGLNYFHISPSPQRFVSLINSDAVRGAVIKKIIDHDKISSGKASDLLNQNLSLKVGNEGEISITFDHLDPEFAKEIVSFVIQKSNEVNRIINQKGIRPIYLYSKKRLSDLDIEYKSLETDNGERDYERGLAINREKYDLQQKLYAIESDMQITSADEYFVLNELGVDEKEKKHWGHLIGLNFLLFLGIVYAMLLYKAFNIRIKSFIKLAFKN